MGNPRYGSTKQFRQVALGLVSAAGLVGVLAGVPLGLLHLGTPVEFGAILHRLAHPSGYGHALTQPVTGSWIAGAAACVAWATWAWFVVCTTVDLVARVRGRQPLHLPGSSRVQTLVAALVGTSITLVPVARPESLVRLVPGVAVSAPVPVQTGAVSLGDRIGNALPLELTADDRIVGGGPTTPEVRHYVVQTGDSLWSVAEQQLGSPLRWQEIAALNWGRSQPNGRSLTDDHWILPGWDLVLPASPDPASPAGASPLPQPTPLPTSPTPPWPELSHVVAAAAAIHAPAQPDRSSEHARASSGIPVGPIGYGVLGAGVVALLEGLRRAQRRHRPAGLRIALPDAELAELEHRLRTGADAEAASWIDLGMRSLLVASRRSGVEPARFDFVRLTEDALEISICSSLPGESPPPPFRLARQPGVWSLPRTPDIADRLDQEAAITAAEAPSPALVTLGRDDTGLVLLDVEHAGSVEVWGTEASAILHSVILELATARWSDQVDLVLVGLDAQLDGMERVRSSPAVAAVLPEVRRKIEERQALMRVIGQTSNWASRWAGGGDAWDLLVLVVAPWAVDADLDAARELVRLCQDGSSGVVVVAGSTPVGARWHVRADGGPIVIQAPDLGGSVLSPQPVDASVANGVASLVDVARKLDGVAGSEPPYDRLTMPFPLFLEQEADGSSDGVSLSGEAKVVVERRAQRERRAVPPSIPVPGDEGPEIEVRVLGPVEVAGAVRPFSRAWTMELVVYLAMHPGGVTTDQWSTALWPERAMAQSSLHSTASAARRALGVASNGSDHMPRSHGRLALAESVGTDWDRFVALASTQDVESWRAALGLVRGRPFEGLRTPDWALLEGIEASIEAALVDLACRLAEVSLSQGSPTTAEWAARQALRVSPYDERLFRILLRSADMAGNPAGVESVMAELVHLVADDVEPFDAVHPETLDLYRSLSRRRGTSNRPLTPPRPGVSRWPTRLGERV
jgi:DNA-binding SARP family transcriptional activator